jgi:aldose 1-epimerase
MLRLVAGSLTLDLAPELGGSILGFRHGDVPLFRPSAPDAIEKGQATLASSYPMIPFCNRITRGQFAFEGETHVISINGTDPLNAIHGLAFQHPWTVTESGQASAEVVLQHEAKGEGAKLWPFAFEARQLFVLDENGLNVTVSLTNRDGKAMPAGFGLHPYFPRHKGTLVRFAASGVWHNRPDLIPVQFASVPKEWDFSEGAAVGTSVIDHCFAGWQGRADIVYREERLALTMTANPSLFGHLTVFDPAGRDFFAVEPMTHRSNGINAPADETDHGVVRLAPGQSLSGTVRFEVSNL